MREESVISPEKKSDLVIINKAVSENYQFNVEECFKAAESIRSLHITAGSTLTRFILNALRDTPPNLDTGLTKLDLDLGSVRVAELEKVLPEKRSRHISEVNNLIISDF